MGFDDYAAIAPWYDYVTKRVLTPLRRAVCTVVDQFDADRSRIILDVCCGTGTLATELAQAGHAVFGVDGSAAMLGQSHHHMCHIPMGTRPRFIRAQARNLPFADNSVDCSILSLCLHENTTQAIAAMLAQAIRVTRPGGCLIAVDYPARGKGLKGMGTLLAEPVEFAAGRAHYAGFKTFLSRGGLEAHLKWAGLVPEQVDTFYLNSLVIITTSIMEKSKAG